jgi:DNA-binding Lrp family transcriptional regulator
VGRAGTKRGKIRIRRIKTMEKRELIRKEILYYIEKNSRANLGELAVLLGTDEVTVANEIAEMEKDKVICGYHTLIDWDKAGVELVTALIEVRMTPQRSQGFDKIAERICNYPEVHAVYLISGGYDFSGCWRTGF